MFVFLSSENRLLAHAYEELGSTPVSLHHRIFIEQPQPASQPGFSGVNVGCVWAPHTHSASAVTILIWVNLFSLPRYLPLLSYYFSCFVLLLLLLSWSTTSPFFFFCLKLPYPTSTKKQPLILVLLSEINSVLIYGTRAAYWVLLCSTAPPRRDCCQTVKLELGVPWRLSVCQEFHRKVWSWYPS
jgi:hypothetical protein